MKAPLSQIFCSLAAVCSVLAAPAASTTDASTTDVTANYDNLPNAPVVKPIVDYKNLNYGNWTYATAQTVQVGGVASQSPFNRIVSAARGTPTFSKQDRPFAPKTIYFGCAARTAEAVVTLAASCSVTFTGYAASNGAQVASQTFKFDPPVSPVAPVPMRQVVFPNAFRQKLGRLTVTYNNQALVALLADTFTYTLFNS
ncbi:MAG: hypothetical protein Q9186_007346 [Xanthomendoza sp. 1 TL-2023]